MKNRVSLLPISLLGSSEKSENGVELVKNAKNYGQ